LRTRNMLPAQARTDLRGAGQLAVGGVFFLVFTIGIFWYQFHRIGLGTAIPSAGQLQWGYVLLILFLLPAEIVLSALRMRMICKILQPEGSPLSYCVNGSLR